jgi:hypothetical protein
MASMASMDHDIWDLRLLELLWIGIEDGAPESPQQMSLCKSKGNNEVLLRKLKLNQDFYEG